MFVEHDPKNLLGLKTNENWFTMNFITSYLGNREITELYLASSADAYLCGVKRTLDYEV